MEMRKKVKNMSNEVPLAIIEITSISFEELSIFDDIASLITVDVWLGFGTKKILE